MELKSTAYEHWFYIAAVIKFMSGVDFHWWVNVPENTVHVKKTI